MALTQKQQKDRAWYANNKERHLDNCRLYKEKNKDSVSDNKKEWLDQNRSKYNEYFVNRRKNDLNFKIAHYLRKRLSKAIKAPGAVKNLGCSIDELKVHLQSKFQPGMTWNNYGEWHIDHIRPLASFNLTDKNQLLLACNYINLQPLWKIDNLKKGAKYGS